MAAARSVVAPRMSPARLANAVTRSRSVVTRGLRLTKAALAWSHRPAKAPLQCRASIRAQRLPSARAQYRRQPDARRIQIPHGAVEPFGLEAQGRSRAQLLRQRAAHGFRRQENASINADPQKAGPGAAQSPLCTRGGFGGGFRVREPLDTATEGARELADFGFRALVALGQRTHPTIRLVAASAPGGGIRERRQHRHPPAHRTGDQPTQQPAEGDGNGEANGAQLQQVVPRLSPKFGLHGAIAHLKDNVPDRLALAVDRNAARLAGLAGIGQSLVVGESD